MAQHYAIVSARYTPEVGGVETFTAHLAHELALEGNRVTVLTSAITQRVGTSEQEDGVSVIRLPSRALMGGRLPLTLRNSQFDELLSEVLCSDITRVLINTRFYSLSWTGLEVARQLGVPTVVLDHGSAYLTLGNELADFAIKGYEHYATRRCMNYHPRFAGISSFSARWLETFGIHTDLVIPNAIDSRRFRESASMRNFRQELGILDDQVLVVSVGRLAPEKGSAQFVDSLRLLGRDYHGAIAGDGPLRKELERNLPPNVTLLGNLSHNDLSALLSQADLFCLPSRSEGFCTSLLEAGSWGLMPLITHVGGTDEVMGVPLQFGALLDDAQPQTIAHMVRNLVETGRAGHSSELQTHIENACSWSSSVTALERAFA